MEVFRISAEKYSGSLTASGSANRWNEDGQYVLYTGSSRSLSSLELVVHRSSIKPSIKYKVMVIYVNDEEDLFDEILQKDLPVNWKSIAAYGALQRIGSKWYTSRNSLILKVPSVIIPQEHDYIINTLHPDFSKKVKLVNVENYFWDSRLL